MQALTFILLTLALPAWAGPPIDGSNPYSPPQSPAVELDHRSLWPNLVNLSRDFDEQARALSSDPDKSQFRQRLGTLAQTTADSARAVLRSTFPSAKDADLRNSFAVTPPSALMELETIIRATILERTDVPTLMAYRQTYQNDLRTNPELRALERDILITLFGLGGMLYLQNRLSLKRIAPNLTTVGIGFIAGGMLALGLTATDMGIAYLTAHPRVAVGLLGFLYGAPTVIRATLNTLFGTRRARDGLVAMESVLGSPALSVVDYRILATHSDAAQRLASSWHPRCRHILEALNGASRWDEVK